MTIYRATRKAYPDDPDQSPYWWASLDDEIYVELNDDPANHPAERVAQLVLDYQKVETLPGGGQRGHIQITRRYLAQTGTTFLAPIAEEQQQAEYAASIRHEAE